MIHPGGNFKCRACGKVWAGKQLYQDPTETATTWTCGDLVCGGVCDPIRPTRQDKYSEAAAYIRRTIPTSDVGGRMVMAAFMKDSIDHEEG